MRKDLKDTIFILVFIIIGKHNFGRTELSRHVVLFCPEIALSKKGDKKTS